MKGILASVQSSLQYVLDVKKKEEEEARALQKGENNALEEMSEMNTSKTSLGRSTTSGKSSGPSSIAKVPMPPPLPLMPVGSSGSAARGASPNISVSRLSVGVHQPNATTKGGKAAESNARKKAKAPKGKRLVFEKENTYASALALLYQKNRQWLQTAGQFQGGTIKVKSLLKSANTVTTTTAATQTDPLENKKRSSRSHSSLQNAPGSPYHGASRATSPDGLPPMHKRPSTAGRGSVLSPGAKRGSSSASQLMGTGSPLRRSMVESKGRSSIPSGRPKKNSSSTSETKLQTILYTPPSHELPDDNTSGGEARPTKITFPSFLNNPNLHGGARSNSNSDSNPAGIATSPNEEGIAQP
ncbi:hypothetical protein AGDE_13013 [Angomonas deanei]|uniref:Uncharacterized protein n=1 Tax=Angomonas deanei TaxID=59799 RepID=A0A7G2C8J1_9TRYP|nr:hypothetical protein AGDE_13013 [Angomonas deanei]CAD2215755.1 hypothetical protein, conserved [Angomonas deanei]|eukprot:EPY23113.1 hypothetical protein AGDE_13013 [Angomonas deanei]